MRATVFWDRNGILLTKFMAPGTTITFVVCCETLNKLGGQSKQTALDAH